MDHSNPNIMLRYVAQTSSQKRKVAEALNTVLEEGLFRGREDQPRGTCDGGLLRGSAPRNDGGEEGPREGRRAGGTCRNDSDVRGNGIPSERTESKDRDRDLNPEQDPNFPPEFKLLILGLRGGYGQKTLPHDEPILRVGLESRAGQNLEDSFALLLPETESGTIDLDALFEHRSRGPRGLVSSFDALSERAQRFGLAGNVVRELQLAIDRSRHEGLNLSPSDPNLWAENLQIAWILLPLNDWLEHPLVQRRLGEMQPNEQSATRETFHLAEERYRQRMNALMAARTDPVFDLGAHYAPPFHPLADWTWPINPVWYREDYPINWEVSENQDPDYYFHKFAFFEACRFVVESGLSRLLWMHRPDH